MGETESLELSTLGVLCRGLQRYSLQHSYTPKLWRSSEVYQSQQSLDLQRLHVPTARVSTKKKIEFKKEEVHTTYIKNGVETFCVSHQLYRGTIGIEKLIGIGSLTTATCEQGQRGRSCGLTCQYIFSREAEAIA